MEKTGIINDNKFINVTKDGNISKKILHAGSGETPKKGKICEIKYKLHQINGKFVDGQKNYEHLVGTQHDIKGLDKAIRSMKLEESARFIMSPKYSISHEKINPNEDVIVDISIISIRENDRLPLDVKILEDIKSNYNEYINLTEDGKIKKKILNKGYGNFPQDGELTELKYKIYLKDGTFVDSSKSYDHVIGQPSIIKGLDIGLKTMKKIETARYIVDSEFGFGKEGNSKLKVPPNSELIIDLFYFKTKVKEEESEEIKEEKEKKMIEKKEKDKIPMAEKIITAKKLKEQGVALFNQQNYNDAGLHFKEAFELLNGEALDTPARELMLSLSLNLGNIFNQLKMYEQTIPQMAYCLRIKTDNPKIYYYRATAYVNLGKLREAEEDVNKLSELLSSNHPNVVALRSIIEEKNVTENKGGSKKLNLFKKGEKLYEDQPYKKEKKKEDDEDDDKVDSNIIKLWDK